MICFWHSLLNLKCTLVIMHTMATTTTAASIALETFSFCSYIDIAFASFDKVPNELIQ